MAATPLAASTKRDTPDVLREPGPRKEAGFLSWAYFLSEIMWVGATATLAYYLRLTDILIPWRQPVFCGDPDYNFKYSRENEPYPKFVIPDSTFYFITVVLPLGVVFVKEGFTWAISNEPSMTLVMCGLGINESFRRVLRFSGCYFMGLCLTSALVDGIQHMVGRPSPSFVYLCTGAQFTNCVNPLITEKAGYITSDDCISFTGTGSEDELRIAGRSFPNNKSALAAYCCLFLASYLKSSLEIGAVFTFKPLFYVGLVSLTLVPSFGDYSANLCHLDAVIWGLIIGVLISWFMVVHLLFFEERRIVEAREQQQLGAARSTLLFSPTAPILPRVQAVNRSVRHYNNPIAAPAQPLSTQGPVPSVSGLQRRNTFASNPASRVSSPGAQDGFYYAPRMDYLNGNLSVISDKPYMAY